MAGPLAARRVAILAADGVEEIELIEPRRALVEAGAQVEVVSLRPGHIQSMNHDVHPAARIPVDRTAAEA